MTLSDIAYPLAGGALIGLSATLLYASHGRIAGITGLVRGLLRTPRESGAFRVWFLLGLAVTGVLVGLVAPEALGSPELSLGGVAVAGLLVGVGTTLANGCTSGHGVCGIARLSPRSLLATGTFMATGIATVLIVRVLGVRS